MSTTLEQELEDAAATVDVPNGDLDAVLRRAGRRSGRRRHIAATIMAVCVIATVAAGVRIAGRGSSTTPAADPPGPSVTAPFDAKRPTRAGLLEVYAAPRPGFPRVDRVEVKKTTWGDLRAVLKRAYKEEQPGSVAPDSEIVYVVVRAGVNLPSVEGFGPVQLGPYPWGVIVLAADGGGPLTTFAHHDGQAWPLFFDQIEDLGGD